MKVQLISLVRYKVILFVFLSSAFTAQAKSSSFDSWVESEYKIALVEMRKNISPNGTMAGCVIASPSQDNPNYYFHWMRDAALVMNAIMISEQRTHPEMVKDSEMLSNYIYFSRQNQLANTLAGLGEPRVNVDGTPNYLDWSRPQNDGSALRTLTLSHYLDLAKAGAYTIDSETRALIKKVVTTDLDYIDQHWADPSYDIWEELKAQHYDTRIKQMEALLRGARWVQSWGDSVKAAQYLKTAHLLEFELDKHWSDPKAALIANLDKVSGAENKHTFLDSAVILSVLHTDRRVGAHSVSDSRVMATVTTLESIFKKTYAINASLAAPAIGRYEDDVYFDGNPWYITTAGFAQYYFELARSLEQNHDLSVRKESFNFWKNLSSSPLFMGTKIQGPLRTRLIKALIHRGDLYVATLQKFTPASGHFSEQFDRNGGQQISAPDLTWSYASFLTLYHARAEALAHQ